MTKLSFPRDKIKVVLLEAIHPKAEEVFRKEGFSNIEWFTSAFQGDELLEKIKDAHIVGVRSASLVDSDLLDQCENLMGIGCFSVGTNNIDLKGALKRGIPVFNDPHSNTRSVAELVIGFMISLSRGLYAKSKAAHSGRWTKSAKGSHELRGKVLGIIGYGRVGTQVSILAESFGMKAVYYDPERKLSIGNTVPTATLEELLEISDFVTLHVPDLPKTRKMIGAKELKLMKPGAFIINTSRGTNIDESALKDALLDKIIFGAAVDVYEKEPSHSDAILESPLRGLENVILTPHIGGATEEAQENIALAMSQKLIHFVNRGATEGAVNFPELGLAPNDESHRILHIHENIPGRLSLINKVISDSGLNILAQYLKTFEDVGYVVVDIEKKGTHELITKLKEIEGTIRTRILY